MTRVRGVDTDNYDGPVSVARFKRLHDDFAIRFNIIGTQVGSSGNFTQVQKDNSKAAGLWVPYHYDFLYWGTNDLERMKWAASFGLPVLMDEETDVHGWSPAQVEHRIGEGRDVLIAEGLFGGHYTAPGFWQTYVGNSMAFAGDPCWLATWPFAKLNQPPVLPPIDYLPPIKRGQITIGGMKLIAQQYADTCYAEAGFDLDCIDREEDPMLRFNADSAWFADPTHQTFADSRGVNARLDFQLPGDALDIEVEIELQTQAGNLTVFDGNEVSDGGNDNAPAFTVEGRVAHGRVKLSPDGWFHMVPHGAGLVLLHRVSCLGIYE